VKDRYGKGSVYTLGMASEKIGDARVEDPGVDAERDHDLLGVAAAVRTPASGIIKHPPLIVTQTP
jgi:hypothetical protein